jgi:acyl-CoA hydrolase
MEANMRFHLTLSLAAALAVTSVVSASAGSLVDPAIEGETMVAPEAAGSMGGLGGGAIVGLIALVAVAAAAGGSSSTTTN